NSQPTNVRYLLRHRRWRCTTLAEGREQPLLRAIGPNMAGRIIPSASLGDVVTRGYHLLQTTRFGARATACGGSIQERARDLEPPGRADPGQRRRRRQPLRQQL